MRTTTFLTSLMATSTFAFNITLHKTNECEGTVKVYEKIKLEDGCQKIDHSSDTMMGISAQWTEESDNDLSIAFFSNDNCCNGGPAGSRGWGLDECTGLSMIRSFRIMDSSDINKGKKGDNYECRNGPTDAPPPAQ
jgi:hypothetical protein